MIISCPPCMTNCSQAPWTIWEVAAVYKYVQFVHRDYCATLLKSTLLHKTCNEDIERRTYCYCMHFSARASCIRSYFLPADIIFLAKWSPRYIPWFLTSFSSIESVVFALRRRKSSVLFFVCNGYCNTRGTSSHCTREYSCVHSLVQRFISWLYYSFYFLGEHKWNFVLLFEGAHHRTHFLGGKKGRGERPILPSGGGKFMIISFENKYRLFSLNPESGNTV